MTVTLEREAPVQAPVSPLPEPAAEPEKVEKPQLHDILIIAYSGELEKTWAAMLLASTAGAMGIKTKVFVTFWALQSFVKDSKRITGQNWMQKGESVVDHGGTEHLKLGKIHFGGAGTMMIKKLAKQYNVASPTELMDMAKDLGVNLYPCQMTMDLYGLTKDDFIDGLETPLGAASFIDMAADSDITLFI
jgi:peroxiredoxin family protein